jgi:hypothetical protein
LIIVYLLLTIVYSLLIIVYSLLIVVHSFLIFFCSFSRIMHSVSNVERHPWSRGRGEDWSNRDHEFEPALRMLSLFSQEKSPEISGDYYGKLRMITENFGTLGSKFPDNIGHSFYPPLTVWSGAIRSGWRNPA